MVSSQYGASGLACPGPRGVVQEVPSPVVAGITEDITISNWKDIDSQLARLGVTQSLVGGSVKTIVYQGFLTLQRWSEKRPETKELKWSIQFM